MWPLFMWSCSNYGAFKIMWFLGCLMFLLHLWLILLKSPLYVCSCKVNCVGMWVKTLKCSYLRGFNVISVGFSYIKCVGWPCVCNVTWSGLEYVLRSYFPHWFLPLVKGDSISINYIWVVSTTLQNANFPSRLLVKITHLIWNFILKNVI